MTEEFVGGLTWGPVIVRDDAPGFQPGELSVIYSPSGRSRSYFAALGSHSGRQYVDIVSEAFHQAAQENCDGDPYDLLQDLAVELRTMRIMTEKYVQALVDVHTLHHQGIHCFSTDSCTIRREMKGVGIYD